MTMPQENAGYFVETRYVTITIPATGAAATLQSLIAAGTDTSTGAAPTADTIARINACTLFNGTGTASYGGSAASIPIAIAASAIISANPLSAMWRKQTFLASTTTAYTAWVQCALCGPTGSHG